MNIFRMLAGRVLQAVVLLFLVSMITFVMIRKAPGLPSILSHPDISEEDSARLMAQLGLDRPLYIQYLDWASTTLGGDLGESLLSKMKVWEMIKTALPGSFYLATTSLLIAVVVAIPLGIISAVKQHSRIDNLVTVLSFGGASVPGFWAAILSILIFSVMLGWLPSSGISPVTREATWIDTVRHLILPATVLSTNAMAAITRYTRSSMIEVLQKHYIRTARAKGLAETLVLVRHALLNALFPVITAIGLLIPVLVGGAAVVETVFAWPGIGRMAIESALRRDYPVVMGVTLFISIIAIVSNQAIDLLYYLLDPRLRESDKLQ